MNRIACPSALSFLLCLLSGWLPNWLASPVRAQEQLALRKGDRICLVGNALGERMQHHNYWETLVHRRFPTHQLAVRNLCFPGDEPYQRIRSLNFGDPDVHLTHSRATVVLYFFGLNESFAGKPGLAPFTAEMTRLVRETQGKNYSGQGAPRVALISPIAFEDTGDPNLPDGQTHNARLAAYTAALRSVAQQTGATFVDLFTPTRVLFEKSSRRLTLNGVHLNDDGYRALAAILDRELFGAFPQGSDSDLTSPANALLREAIADKNFHWWHRYRAVNGFSIYGTRGAAGSDGTYNNTDVMERERAILDQMTANRDQRIWSLAGQLAAGKPAPERLPEVDDSNTQPFIEPRTNVGLPDDPNRKAGKLGSLDYLNAEEQQKRFKLAPGFEINLVASEEQFPELANPVALNFDNRGRLWVATMPSYPQWKPKTKLDDKLLILEDQDGDGRADACRVFADGLHQPTGFEIGRGGVYVAQQPDILFLKDTDGDDAADVRIRQLVGFDSADSHHGISAFEWGPGGGLYFQEGTFKYSQVESPYGLTRLNEGGIWRYDPRTERFGVHVSLAFANPWGHVFDEWGQNFIADASPGFSYWAAPISGHIPFPLKHPGGSQHRRLARETGGDPRYQFPTFYPKRTRPSAGCELVYSSHFPPEMQGNFLLTNCISERAILNHRVREAGSGFAGEEIAPLVSCEDGNFRPVDLQFGPDGSLYLVDWHNALIGHLQHNLRDPSRDHSHGRIWRITYKHRPLVTPPRVAGEALPALLNLLKSPEGRVRYQVRRELAERKTADVKAALDAWVADLEPADAAFEHQLLEALWIYQTHNVVETQLLGKLLEAKDHRGRAAAVRTLSFWREQVPDALELLARRVNDPHPRPRLEAVRALSYYASQPRPVLERAIEVALDVLNHETDEYLEYTLNETLRALQPSAAGHEEAAHAGHAGHAGHKPPGDAAAAPQQPKPLLFLEKSPRIVQFQLDRLPASQLLLAERSPDAAKYRPVYEAILGRVGVSRQDREEAARALAELTSTHLVQVLLDGIGQASGPGGDANGVQVARQLAGILLGLPRQQLADQAQLLRTATAAEASLARSAALAGVIAGGDPETAWRLGQRSAAARRDFLASVPLVPARSARAALRGQVVACLDSSQPLAVRRAAVAALAAVPAEQQANFRLVSPLVADPQLRDAAVRTLTRIPPAARPAKEAGQVVATLVQHAERTPAAKRTSETFLDAMHLADELLPLLPAEQLRAYRQRLRDVVVRVVLLKTVEEEMRYDTPYFAVEAGRPVQLVLRNEDLMPHNLVIADQGKFREVVQQAAGLPPTIDSQGRQYVPDSAEVLFATRMVPAHSQDVLTFTAPSQPGEYPYVCTFPNHWMRMYGVMVVVPDLDAWRANPTVPTDPLGNTRKLVQSWTLEDFEEDLAAAVARTSGQLGARLFKEATCLQCHKLRGEGGAVGPDLTEVTQRHKGDLRAVLRELLEPSHKIDPKYAVYNVITFDGKVISGIISEQNAKTITVIANPENPKPQVIPRDDIDQLVKSSTSMMPKGLLDRYTREEILVILKHVTGAAGN